MGARPSRVKTDHVIDWVRPKVDPAVSAAVHRTSDLWGGLQTAGWLASLAAWFFGALYFHAAGSVAGTVACVLLYGAQANFAINGMHELGHGFVFRTPAANAVALRVVSFLGWLHPDMFFSSHWLHHRFTQNPPHDLENPMPVVITLTDFLLFGFVNAKGAAEALAQTLRAALGVYPTGHLGWLPEWEARLYRDDPGARAPAMAWAWVLLAGHAAVAAAALSRGAWLIPLMVSGGPFYNGWLFFLCNATQHVGLHPSVSDFRLNSRTFYLNPVLRFWYWHMNWHTEHHAFPAVPCYNLATLHEAIKADLPPAPDGIVAVWTVIIDALRRQREDPAWVQPIAIPGRGGGGGGGQQAGPASSGGKPATAGAGVGADGGVRRR
jgi:fatty acid desaturase